VLAKDLLEGWFVLGQPVETNPTTDDHSLEKKRAEESGALDTTPTHHHTTSQCDRLHLNVR
jgi:hypothetical protein